MYTCPVCGFAGLLEPAWDGNKPSHQICACCGVQYGYHDDRRDPEERLRRQADLGRAWIAKGMPWHRPPAPRDWDAVAQLKEAGFAPN